PMVLEADRTTEYAPVKSFQGENSPGASRQAMMDEWAAWLAGCGVQIPKDGHGRIQGSIEISPLFASSLEELRERLDGRSVFFKDPLLLE
ncbi:MAG: hypothetical protein ACE5GW_12670, partial [Planctomycetota bacterium]